MSLKIHNNVLLLLTFVIVNLYLVVETQQPISVYDISQDEVSKYIDEVEKHNGLLSLVRESFHIDFDVYRSITDVELRTIGRTISDDVLKNLVSRIVLVGENGLKYANRTLDNETGFKTVFFAFRRNLNGKYDVVYCTAKQIRDIDLTKIGYIAVIAGITASAVPLAVPYVAMAVPYVGLAAASVGLVAPYAGLKIGAAAVCAVAGTGFYQQNYMEMQNVILGYIGNELSNRKLLVLT
ncbi:unnamed protein product [Adineta steineri]|uniref:Uncharacterized protein n=1 Tax=Adineta steineri TaxID=433720 RepID=A0A813VBU3_9BILA|nr:unnamed protein product [Adineta steineri]CAF3520558.1 unnamed protein product [Adineta steineri]